MGGHDLERDRSIRPTSGNRLGLAAGGVSLLMVSGGKAERPHSPSVTYIEPGLERQPFSG